MEVGKLTVHVRQSLGKGQSRRLRAEGKVPGICYGAGLDRPLAIVLNAKELKASLDPAKGRNTVINVRVENGEATPSTELTALLWDYQIDALRRHVTHVDLISIDPDKPIQVEVPLVLIGKAIGTVDGGQIHVERHTLPVRCKPADIPTKFEVDITPLKIGDALHVTNLVMPPGVQAAVPEGFTIVTCVAPKVEKEVVETAAVPVEGAAPAEGAAAPAEGDKKEGAAATPAGKGATPAGKGGKSEGGSDEKKK
ncbi:MAG TPA: 50S ribosomal protein L25 [Candidatus Acidoferrum sp.]|nr:50S ribosomal protein L25 [Candidatus Acidoferrum sp.]